MPNPNDTGADVRQLQDRLKAAGFEVETDGWYGPNTEAAVRAYQQQHGLAADGIAGPKTIAALAGGQANPLHLTQADIERAAKALDIEPAAVLAINEVETKGHGFMADGRPVILFERHIMYRQIKEAGKDADALAAKYPELVNPKRGGYQGGAQEWYRLNLARQIDADAANASASWGKFQIMGFNWQACGFGSVGEFVEAMCQSEGRQLDAFVGFVKANPPLHKALKVCKWADVARLYNGPDYKENNYDAKLASAYKRHAGAMA